MVYCFETNKFHIEYVESIIDQPIIWERHCHSQYEMILVSDGDITVTLEGKSYRLKKNQIIIIPPLFYHSVTANEKGSYHRITALFEIDSIPEVLQPEFEKMKADTVVFSSDRSEKLKTLCQKNDQAFFAPLMQSLMIEILYDSLIEKQNNEEIEIDEFLQKTLEYIDRHLHEKILLDDLARQTSRSKSSFCHLFEKKMRISPKQYILQKKLALASKLIDEGMPHTLAAIHVGYDNYSNFYRLYYKNHKK